MHERGYHRRSVLLRDAVIYLEEEVCALDMEQRSNYGAVRDAQKILPSRRLHEARIKAYAYGQAMQ